MRPFSHLPPPPAPAPAPLPAEPLAVARILVVDDQAVNLTALEAMLERSDCTLVRAHSADEAMLALLENDFAAIVLDVMMPGMGGVELAQLIKQRRRSRDVPILFLTAHTLDEHEVLRGYGAGGVDYLVKPVHSDILRSKIEVFIDLFRKTQALARANDALQQEVMARVQIEDALRDANQELERRVLERTEALRDADRRKDEFLASLAHELRNPLAPIRSAVEILKNQPPNPGDAEQARAVVIRQVAHMTRLIDDLLDVSRITVDKLVLQTSMVDLSAVISTAVETSRPLISARRHHLTVTLPDEPVILEADPTRLAQVIGNLLTNAAKYTPAGGDIRLVATVNPDKVVICIQDNGIGIDAETMPRIFELFAQGGQAPELATGGLGIGLTLARRLVEMHKGSLHVTSAGPGLGTESCVQLPLAPGASASVTTPQQELGRGPKKRVLVVDDNHDAAEMLSVMLQAWGQTTKVAYDGFQALQLGDEFCPEIVLLDLGLPMMDGYETARRMRQTAWGPGATIIAVTGWGGESDFARSRAAGFDHHLVKPVSPEMLHGLISQARIDPA